MNSRGRGSKRPRGGSTGGGGANGSHNGNGRNDSNANHGNWRNDTREYGQGRGQNNFAPNLGNDQNFPSILNAFIQLGNQRTSQTTVPVPQPQPGPSNANENQNSFGRGRGRGRASHSDRRRPNQNVGKLTRNENNGDVNATSSDDSEEEERRTVVKPTKKKERKFEGPVFGFKRLYNFLKSSPDEVLLSINRDKEDWKVLLESKELDGEKLIVAIEAIGQKVCIDVPILLQQQTNALTACCSHGFISKLDDAVPKIAQGYFVPQRRRNNEFPVDAEPTKVMGDILLFCSFAVKTMPETAMDFLSKLIVTCIGASCMCDPTMTIMNKFKTLNEQLMEATVRTRQKEEKMQRQRKQGFNKEDEAEFDADTPPNNIEDIEVIPSVEELRCRSEQIFLRPNKQTGSYKDSKHYLDVQFRLLREDFVHPLRKGINIFIKDKSAYLSRQKRMPLGEVRLYPEVKFLRVEKERDSIVHKLQLHECNYKKIKWDKSKRLLTGSLILLSTEENSFQQKNTHFGVVFSRQPKELEKGIVTVVWESSPPVYDEDEDYFMLESEVYLEAYRHTLETLKKLELDNFPMKKFIVDAESSVDAPKYLKNATTLLEVKLANGEVRYLAPVQNDNWPTAAEFGLDENQLQAYKAALTKEFTIIQGPPGTGKTFLGLKVAEVLLKNSSLWEDEGGNPITVVCYTNHALDQFLEGILRYYQKEDVPAEIIRIGGRCKSEVLEKFSLREVRYRNRRRIPQSCWTLENQAKQEIYDLEAERGNRMNEVTGLQDVQGIVDFERLSVWNLIQPLFPNSFWHQLQNLGWLGISNTQLKREGFPREDLVSRYFDIRVREFSKNQKKRTPAVVPRQDVVQRNNVDIDDNDDEYDEDYDLDELLDNRILDDILLEAETTFRENVGRRLYYLPDCSVHTCEKRIKQMNRNTQENTKGLNMADAIKARDSVRGDLYILENRRRLLNEICKLYKEQRLVLPNVTELLMEIQGEGTVHFHQLKMEERWALYFAMVEWARRHVAESVADLEKQLTVAQKELRNIIQYGDGLILKGCKVVGLTTTGAAKYNNLLKMIKSKIVIVEEAAEVFESHIVTCITENCEQLILIGDHRQLRPSPTVYDLAVKYHLDLSLFERMLNNKLHCYQLKIQHRMRPDISDLVVDTIYEELINHDSVKLYPDVKGVTKNVFFVSHTEMESSETDSMSKSNSHEARFIAGLCRYLIMQGYTPDEITVLTMYTGQMFLMKREIHATCKGVRITCVDNFQGEENKIILLSLVRSNTDGKIGFLSIENRICVSLSRAQHGMFIIGNMEQMGKNKTWRAIREKLEVQEGIGPELELECQIHATRTRVQKGEDFIMKVPQGGCLLLCDTILLCTHKCAQLCHVMDKDHKEYKCRAPCLKRCQNPNTPHPCKGKCFESCPPCLTIVEKTLKCELQHKKMMACHKQVEGVVCWEQVLKKLPCSHEETLACHINIHSYVCKVKVDKSLPCNHKKVMECHVDPASVRCKIVVPKLLPCEHTQDAECWLSEESIKCETIVTKKFAVCGHEMKVKCGDKAKPIVCRGQCTTRLACGHACVKVCHVDDDPNHLTYQCKKPCGNECSEGHKCKSSHFCYKTPCPPCKEKVMRDLPCGHRKELECHVDIEKYDCLETCERLLPDPRCRHKCSNLCFQPCGPCMVVVKKRADCGHSQTVKCSELALKENCKELVRPRTTPICGHTNSTVPCKYDQLSAEQVAKFCQNPCDHAFNPAAGGGCGHKCNGTCSSCLQGRIHQKCSSECGRQLVCGHVCDVPCSSVCPPCKKPCMMKCEHSECTKKCGEPCPGCKEKCSWECQHKVCTMLCGEMCDREPCNEPCPLTLKCGHACVGFCGEPCPPLCRICDLKELTDFFLLGNEEDEDARFVYLEDCRHTIEVEGLEQWLLTSSESSQIAAKRCPRCKTAIRNCRRFGNLIRQHYGDIVKVKMRAFGNRANTERMRNAWITTLNNDPPMERIFPQTHARLRGLLVEEVSRQYGGRTATQLIPKTIDEFAMRSLEFIADSTNKVAAKILDLRQKGQLVTPQYEDVIAKFRSTLSCMLDRQPLSRQEIFDFNEELDRLDFYKQLMMRRSLPNCSIGTKVYPKYKEAKDIVTSRLPFNHSRKNKFKALLKELDELLRSGLGITDRERQEILKAMGMSQGHWYKCPNGHIYAITECGGAMVESRCNECNATIGGGNHRLRGDNQVATEMDGATQAAWPPR